MRSFAAAPLALFLTLVLAACGPGDGSTTGPPPPDGGATVTLRLVSPGGPEGAALLEVDADPVLGAAGDGDLLYSTAAGNRLRLVLVRAPAGELRASLTLSDGSADLHPAILQVADSLNVLRPDLSGYAVEIAP